MGARTYLIEIDPGGVPRVDVVADARIVLDAADVAYRFEHPDDELAHSAADVLMTAFPAGAAGAAGAGVVRLTIVATRVAAEKVVQRLRGQGANVDWREQEGYR